MLQRVSNLLLRGTELVVMILMAILLLIVVASVFFRYILL